MERSSATALVAVSKPGSDLAIRLLDLLPGARAFLPDRFVDGEQDRVQKWRGSTGGLVGELFAGYRSLVIFGSAGMAIRLIAPLVRDKHSDPAVVVVDDAGRFAVSLLSGHIGGANALAETVAKLLGAQAVVTTGSEVLGTLAVDLLGREFGWQIDTPEQVTRVSAAVVNGDPVGVFQDAGEAGWLNRRDPLPSNLSRCESLEQLRTSRCSAALVITDRALGSWLAALPPTVIYRPRTLVAGVGCNRGTGWQEIETAVFTVMEDHGLARGSLRTLATIDLKRDEMGLQEFAARANVPIEFFSAEQLEAVRSAPNPSPVVRRYTGASGVCEPAALLASGAQTLLVSKVKTRNVTVAVARGLYATREEQ